MDPMNSFDGLRVLALESRRAAELAKLITTYGGKPIVAPSMREVPLESNTEALAFARTLLAGEIDMVIFLTGVGTRALLSVVETAHKRDECRRIHGTGNNYPRTGAPAPTSPTKPTANGEDPILPALV